VLAFDYNFYQDFTLPVNTFPGKMSVKVDGQALTPGEDYLVMPSSGSSTGTYDLLWLDEKTLKGEKALMEFQKIDKRKKVVVLDSKEAKSDTDKAIFEALKDNPFKAKGVIWVEDNKLTWSVAQTQDNFVGLEILRDKLPRDAQTISLDIEAKFERKHRCQNVLGFIEGSEEPDSFIVFTAHYDHLGRMGADTYFPGANDNASGISMLLNLAKYYTQPENAPKYSIAFIAFGAEEPGLVGSNIMWSIPCFRWKKSVFWLTSIWWARAMMG